MIGSGQAETEIPLTSRNGVLHALESLKFWTALDLFGKPTSSASLRTCPENRVVIDDNKNDGVPIT
jgi:hypothetical protein